MCLRASYKKNMKKKIFFCILVFKVGSGVGSGSGSISQRYGFADPDPQQNDTNPQHRFQELGESGSKLTQRNGSGFRWAKNGAHPHSKRQFTHLIDLKETGKTHDMEQAVYRWNVWTAPSHRHSLRATASQPESTSKYLENRSFPWYWRSKQSSETKTIGFFSKHNFS